MMKRPKVVILGAGSYFFGKQIIWKMVKSEILNTGTLALVDSDPARLDVMMKLAKRTIESAGVSLELTGSTNRREVIKGADFGVLSFSKDNLRYRNIDTTVAAKYGVRMCSSDTIGPGGIFRALREVPEALLVAKDFEELASDAWLINFVNPTAALGISLMRHSKIKSLALCDGNYGADWRLRFLKILDLVNKNAETVPESVENKLDMRIGGVNHCTFLTKLCYESNNYVPLLAEHFRQRAKEELSETPANDSKARYSLNYAMQLYDVYGAFPTEWGHVKEYVPFFQGTGVSSNFPEPLMLFDSALRIKDMADDWEKTRSIAEGEQPIETFLDKNYRDIAADLIESMWGNLGKRFFINGRNDGCISNMGNDAFVELYREVNMEGLQPCVFGNMPRGLLALQQQVLDTHELTVEAAVYCDRNVLYRAMAVDPIVNNLGDARKIIEELLDKEKDALPEGWYGQC